MGIESPDGVAGIGGLLRDAFDTLRSNLEQLTEEQAIANGKKEQLETELSHQSSLCEVSRLWSVENMSVSPSLCLSVCQVLSRHVWVGLRFLLPAAS